MRERARRVLVRSGEFTKLEMWRREAIEFLAATSCSERKLILKRLAGLRDKRTLPALELIATSRRGCGPRGDKDCHRRIRKALRALIKELRKL